MMKISRGALAALAAAVAIPATVAIARGYDHGGWQRMSPETRERLEDGEVRHFAELFTRQVGLALARARMSEAARSASVRAQTEEMRSEKERISRWWAHH